jgi:hypothetical protein
MPSDFTASLPPHGGGPRARLYANRSYPNADLECALNGIIAVPIMAVMMVVVTRLSMMGRFSARPTHLSWVGRHSADGRNCCALLWSSVG